MVAFIRRLFRSPSAFERDWRGYTLNQLGHTFLIGTAPVILLGPWAIPVILAAYLCWEAAQYIRFEAEAWDCAEDMGFVILGALAALWPLVLGAVAAFLAAGALRRI